MNYFYLSHNYTLSIVYRDFEMGLNCKYIPLKSNSFLEKRLKHIKIDFFLKRLIYKE